MGTELELYQDDDLPRALQDAETLRLLQPMPTAEVEAIEKGQRFHPNGITEVYERVEFR